MSYLSQLAETAPVVSKRIARDVVSASLQGLGEGLFQLNGGRREKLKRRGRERPKDQAFRFTDEERATVEALSVLIVPSDGDTPGSRDIEALGPSALSQIEGWVARSVPRQEAYAWGLVALDEMATRSHGKRFAELSLEGQQDLFRTVEARHRALFVDGPGSALGKVMRKLRILRAMWEGWGAAVYLYPMVISDSLKAFYTSEVAWLWLGYDGPPMPHGYSNLAEPRPRLTAISLQSAPKVPGIRVTPRGGTPDVVVIGCGAGGAVAAKELAEAGLDVVVIDAGRRYDSYTDYRTNVTDFEAHAKRVFDPEDERRDAYTTSNARGFSYSRVKGIGGSTLHYAAMSPRLHEADFRAFSEDGVGDDWPLTYADLEPYYTRVEYELGLSGPGGAAANPFDPPRSRPFPTPAHPLNLAGQAVKRGADRLGLHFVREPLAMPSTEWEGRPACVGAGTCHMGCQIAAKSSMDVTYVRKAEATGKVEIRTECMATEIEVDDRGRARGVVYRDKQGRAQRIDARIVVLAGNAVESARLLLMSTSSQFPQGLANSSGLVGKRFMEHLAVFAFGLFPERVDPWRGTPTAGMIQDFYATRKSNGFARGWTTLVTNNSHWPFTVANRLPGWGSEHKSDVKKHFGHYVCVATIGEQLPDERNRVELDPLEKDNFGLPVPRLINEPGENDRAMIKAIKAHLKTLLESAGATAIWGNEQSPGMSSHYLGTCRMGLDPSRSVVDPWGRAHDVPNLFIADSSVYVTGGAVNPALTISALASRTAEGIVGAFRRGEF